MQIIKNEKKFKILEISQEEMFSIGGYGICDSCNKSSHNGFLICVLHWWICEKCYKEWYVRAINYVDDQKFEQKIFDDYIKKFEKS